MVITDLVKINQVEKIGPYRLKLWFSDGRSGEWDFSSLAQECGPMVEPFKDTRFFDRVFLDSGALTWPNGFDWSPEALHADMLKAGALSFEGVAAE